MAALVLAKRASAVICRTILLVGGMASCYVATEAVVTRHLLRTEAAATARYLSTLRLEGQHREAVLAKTQRERDLLARRARDRRDGRYRLAVAVSTSAARLGRRLTETDALEIAAAVRESSERFGVPARLVLGMIATESSFSRYAVSRKGAMGLLQLMPRTGCGLATELGIPITSREDFFEPSINIELGTYYLAKLLQRKRSLPEALTAYNVGPNRVSRIRRGYVGSVFFAAGR